MAGTQWTKTLGYVLYLFIFISHIQLSSIHKGYWKTFSKIPSYSLDQARTFSAFGFTKIGVGAIRILSPVAAKVNHGFFELDSKVSACCVRDT